MSASLRRRLQWPVLLIIACCCLLSETVIADTNAVERGLAWLARQQRPDGAWSENAALNSLPLLAFYSAGHTPESTTHGDRIERGLQVVLKQQAPDGAFTTNGAMMYGHGITTLLLAESIGMSREGSQVRGALAKAVELILRAQAVDKVAIHAGGWRYDPASTDSDLSVTVWQMVALKAAAEVDVRVPRPAIERAIAYIQRCEHVRGGFGYQPGGLPNQSRTAAAMVTLRLCGLPHDPAVGRAKDWLSANPVKWPDPFFFSAIHHAAHAGVGFDPKLVIERQNPDGSWSAQPDSPEERKAGPLYTTSMAIMALTAKWNYLPAYLW